MIQNWFNLCCKSARTIRTHISSQMHLLTVLELIRTHQQPEMNEDTQAVFVLRKSFCIYSFEQTSRYRQRVLIYRAARDVKMSAKTRRYLQMDYGQKSTKNEVYHKTFGTLHSITNSMDCTVKNQKMANLHEIQHVSN